MDELQVRALGNTLEQLAQEQAMTAWRVGDIIHGMTPPDMEPCEVYGAIVKAEPKIGNLFTRREINLYTRAAGTFSLVERSYRLPWCMYAYTVKHSPDPVGWINMSIENNWNFAEMRKAILEERGPKTKAAAEPDLPDELGCWTITDMQNDLVGVIRIWVDMADLDADPIVEFKLAAQNMGMDGLDAIRRAIEKCIDEVHRYYGLQGITRIEGLPDRLDRELAVA